MTTTADVLTAARRHLYGVGRSTLNQLAQDMAISDNQFTVSFPLNLLSDGSVVSVGLEDMYVWAINAAAGTVQVQRGWQGSVQSAHSHGDLVSVNPRFTDFDILTHVNDDLQDLSSPLNGLYQIRTATLTAVSGRIGYDFPTTGLMSIADVRWQIPNSQTQEWRQITDYTVERNMPTATFPSGQAFFLNGPQPTAEQPIIIRYRATLGQLGSLTDDVASVTGLLESATDLPALGAAIRIMAGRPISRAQFTSQGDSRRAQEVTTSDVINAPTALRQLRLERLSAESTRLSQQWAAMTRPLAVL